MKMHRRTGAAGMVVGALTALVVTGQPAGATDGYFQVGFGPRQSALGGAGVADSRDAMAQTLNPAGIVGVENQILGERRFAHDFSWIRDRQTAHEVLGVTSTSHPDFCSMDFAAGSERSENRPLNSRAGRC